VFYFVVLKQKKHVFKNIFFKQAHISNRRAPDPEFCYLAGSGSMSDPDMSDPDPNRILVTSIQLDPNPNLDYCRQQDKNYSFCTAAGKAGMAVYPIL